MTHKGQAQLPAEERRKRIVDAAYALFVSQGYNGTSIRDIARKSDSSLSNLYYYYQDKEAIFTAVFTENHPYLQLLPILNEAADNKDAESIMRDVGKNLVTYLQDHPQFLNLVFIEVIEFQGQHLRAVAQNVIPSMQTFTRRFSTAPGHEELRPLSADIILRAFVGMFVAYAVSKQILGKLTPDAKTDNIDTYIDIFLHGILQQDASQP
ncbi:MAG TPA: TetR/AcrR family transcriptional regulator [Anaerolineae bacterium]